MPWRAALAAVVLDLVLIQPNHPGAVTWQALRLFPLELPVLLLGLLALPARGVTTVLRAVLVAVLTLLAALKAADLGSFIAFGRGFNALTDMNLVTAAWRLAADSSGAVPASLAALGLGLGLVLVAAALWWATGVWARLAPPGAVRGAAAVLVLPALAVAIAEIGAARGRWTLPVEPPGAAFTARLGLERVATWRRTLRDLAAFRRRAERDPFAGRAGLFAKLDAADLIVTFVESYGRASFDNPLYAPTHTATLRRIEERLGDKGLAMRSGWLTSPTLGGQSWLAHGAVASGLRTDGQGRYRAMLQSPRRTLYDYARAAGRRTAAIMPELTLPWPEGAYFGFDAIYRAGDLGYAGKRFNFVTMPDQFTLAAFDRLERDGTPGSDRAPLTAQVVLVSSHAPWVPVPPVIDWDRVGDGTVFDRWAESGDPPEVVWQDNDRVRAQYRKAIDYSLKTLGSYLARHADDRALTVILGDHQPAGFVSGSDNHVVPVHVIGPPRLVALLDGPGWTDGMIPAPDAPAPRMSGLRDRLLGAVSAEGAG